MTRRARRSSRLAGPLYMTRPAALGCVLLLALGVAAAAAGDATGRMLDAETAELVTGGDPVQAVVVEVDHGTRRWPGSVVVRYEVAGDSYQRRLYDRGAPARRAGDRVTVYVDPVARDRVATPDGHLARPGWMVAGVAWLLAVGTMLLVAALTLLGKAWFEGRPGRPPGATSPPLRYDVVLEFARTRRTRRCSPPARGWSRTPPSPAGWW